MILKVDTYVTPYKFLALGFAGIVNGCETVAKRPATVPWKSLAYNDTHKLLGSIFYNFRDSGGLVPPPHSTRESCPGLVLGRTLHETTL